MKCIIAEKPSVAKSIASVLGVTISRDGYMEGNDFVVTWAFGHLLELAKPNDCVGYTEYVNNTHYSEPFFPTAFPLFPRSKPAEKGPNKGKLVKDESVIKQLNTIKSCFDRCSSIVVATDAGREGELIFRYIYQYLHCKKPFERLWISSLTEQAIKDGFRHLEPGRSYDNLYSAGKLRSESDWLVGMNGSRALRFIFSGERSISLGRVQTPTLAMICKRYYDNKNFKSRDYFKVKAILGDKLSGLSVVNKTDYETVLQADKEKRVLPNGLTVLSDTTTKEKEDAPLLFDLTALQKYANNKFNLTAESTLSIAQKLYEQKLITYPRTGSRYIPDDVFETIPTLIAFLRGRQPDLSKLNRRSVDTSKVTDHHALLPTGEKATGLSDLEQKIYDAICIRMLEAFAPPCWKDHRKFEFSSSSKEIYTASSYLILSKGWRAIQNEDTTKEDENDDVNKIDVAFPPLTIGELIPVQSAEIKAKKTKPKPLYTDATLLTAMELAGREINEIDAEAAAAIKDCGLGTPATRAQIIERLLKVGYVVREKKSLKPTDMGLKVYDIIKEMTIGNAIITSQWEKKLLDIERGTGNTDAFEQDIKELVCTVYSELRSKKVDIPEGQEKKEPKPFVETDIECPLCHSKMRMYDKVVTCPGRNCEYHIYREIAGKKFSDEELYEILTNKTSLKPIDFFSEKKNKHYSAFLVWNNTAKKFNIKFD